MDEKDSMYYYNNMKIFSFLADVFTKEAAPLVAGEAEFRRFLTNNAFWSFSEADKNHLVKAITAMGLPLPEPKNILQGTEGPIIFMDDHGIVLRIEAKHSMSTFKRIDNHPQILQPIGSSPIGENYLLEICPGCHTSKDKDLPEKLFKDLKQDGIYYMDRQPANNGYLPLKTPEFPKGIPVIIDRLAVQWLSMQVAPVIKAIENDPQQKLYADLRRSFAQAWPQDDKLPDTEAMKAFWQLCRQAKDEGRLVSGWVLPEGEEPKFASIDKGHMAAQKGAAYAQQTRGLGV